MRIISGKWKRSNLYTLEGEVTRPTKDIVKEALYSSIQINDETQFLDLFSGSGSIGLEALSRGCKLCIFNDINKDAVKVIEKNLNKFGINLRVLNLDYKECISKLKNTIFNYIYIDPPYSFNEYNIVFDLLDKYRLADDNTLVIVEVRKTTDLNNNYNDFKLIKDKRYGISKLLYYSKGK